ncbi:MAG: phytanoyl-CoA dioxygenase [Silicimonas sp.]|nr:phytanoyl-CoA dioxygenase [Silicimonas sp.]
MDAMTMTAKRRSAVWLSSDAGDFDTFRDLIEAETNAADLPLAADIQKRIPVYDGAFVRTSAADDGARLNLLSEWNAVFEDGPGVIVIKAGMEDLSVVDQASAIFEAIIAREKAEGTTAGDHFAKPGANDRVWNAAQKHCLTDPDNFAAYYATDAIAMASSAWLGRGYQVTAQVNRVNPGGAKQTAHRDYHLGFMNADQLATYPIQAHRFSPGLTLQGAVAHCDMPLESGPTMLLPYSQRFLEGYVAYNRPEFQTYFAKHHVQLPLDKGDLLFFNPAVMHGAGDNVSTNIYRMANLLQVGSAFGRSIETVDRSAMAVAVYPALQKAKAAGLSARACANVIAAAAEGYAFPTNLDLDTPTPGSMVPLSPAERMQKALDEGKSPQAWSDEVAEIITRRAS